MPRGRKHVVCGTRLVREGSEESTTEDAPKIKAERLEEPHLVSPTGTRRSPRSKITDYFSSPPVLVPEVPLPDHDIKIENDRASDKSEGDSGKENEENNDWRGSRNSIRSTTRALGAKPKQPAKNIQKTAEPNRVTTRSSLVADVSSASKMPLTLSTTDNATPPASPTKATPTSPPTPHKIKFLGELSPAASALHKLKISLTPKKVAQDTKGPKKRVQPPAPKPSVTATSSKKQLANAATSSHKVTEYFPIRRSNRKPKTELLKERLADIEHHLLCDTDDNLDIEVRNYPEKGRGVAATRAFEKGEFVVEYSGEIIDTDSAKNRESKYAMDLSTGCYMYYFKHKGKQYCIDATAESGRVGRLVNHSRVHPNLQTKVVTLKDKPRLILVARRDIQEGEELLYDYGDRSKESLKAHPWLNY